MKRTFEKPVPISSQVLLDRERCVLCARCTRFSDQIAGDPLIGLFERGAHQQIGDLRRRRRTAADPFQSYFSGNTVQILPGRRADRRGLPLSDRGRSTSSPPLRASASTARRGCAQRTDFRHGATVLRRLAGDDPEVNEEWNCDKGRWAFTYTSSAASTAVIESPLVRDAATGELVSDLLDLSRSRPPPRHRQRQARRRSRRRPAHRRRRLRLCQVRPPGARHQRRRLPGPSALGRGDGVPRRRPSRAPGPPTAAPSPTQTSTAAPVPSSSPGSSPRKSRRSSSCGCAPPPGTRVSAGLRHRPAAHQPGLAKCFGTLVQTKPPAPRLRRSRRRNSTGGPGGAGQARRRHHRSASGSPPRRGRSPPLAALAAATGARSWRGSRAGPETAVLLEAGLLPSLLPGGRPVTDAAARGEVAAAWGTTADRLPAGVPGATLRRHHRGRRRRRDRRADRRRRRPRRPGRPGRGPRGAHRRPRSWSSPSSGTPPQPSWPTSSSPSRPVVEKAGTYLDWEGRARAFERVLPETFAQADVRRRQPARQPRSASTSASRPSRPPVQGDRDAAEVERRPRPPLPDASRAGRRRRCRRPARRYLASWHWLLDEGTLQEAEPHLAGTRRAPRGCTSPPPRPPRSAPPPASMFRSRRPVGAVTLPLIIADLPDRVVWIPTKSPGSHLSGLGVVPGAVVSISVVPAKVVA